MPISALRSRVTATLLEFAWEEWAQMGLFATARQRSPWPQDPEALLLLTFEVARDEPRLFDEVLDWLARNEPVVSARRLRTLCTGPADQRLLTASLAWTARVRGRRPPQQPRSTAEGEELLFRGLTTAIRDPDPAFLDQGLIRATATPTRNAAAPDLRAPINLAFRLRHILGVSARAEAVRFLLTVDAPRASVAAVTRSAAYAKRNVQEALTSLHAADTVSLVDLATEQQYRLDRSRWAQLLGLTAAELPRHRDWPQLLGALRTIARWLSRSDLDELSEYLRGSHARELLDLVQGDLAYAGVAVAAGRTGEGAWDDLVETIDNALSALAR